MATVFGQDIQTGEDGAFRIVRGVATDRVISVVDPDARHGRKTSARGFDGFKGHAAVDHDSEVVTETTATPGNAGDSSVAADLITDLVPKETPSDAAADPAAYTWLPAELLDDLAAEAEADAAGDAAEDEQHARGDTDADAAGTKCGGDDRPKVYGDAAYGSGELQKLLDDSGIDSGCRTQAPAGRGGRFAKDRFDIDLEARKVTCPGNVTVKLTIHRDRSGSAHFGDACATRSLRDACTKSRRGLTIHTTRHEAVLTRARARQSAPGWVEDYRATRPKVERKLGHLMRRKHGGRRSRVRGTSKVDADFNFLAGLQTWRASPCSDSTSIPPPDGRKGIGERRGDRHRPVEDPSPP